MIPGIVSSQQRRRLSGALPDIPAGSYAYLDFVNDIYYASGATWHISQLLGGNFDILSLEAKGMDVGQPTPSLPATNWPIAIGALFNTISALLQSGGVTLVYEFDVSDSVDLQVFGPITHIFNNADPDLATEVIYMQASGAFPGGVDLSDEGTILIEDAPTLSHSAIQKIAYTLSRDAGGGSYEYAATGMGQTAVSDTANYVPSAPVLITLFGIEAWDFAPDGPLYVRKLTVYPAVAAASLHEYSGGGGAVITAAVGEASGAATAEAVGATEGTTEAVGNASGTATAEATGEATGGAAFTTFDPATVTNVTLSNGNLTAAHSNTTSNSGARSAAQKNSGKHYFEITCTDIINSDGLGVLSAAGTYTNVITNGSNGGFVYTTTGCGDNLLQCGNGLGGSGLDL